MRSLSLAVAISSALALAASVQVSTVSHGGSWTTPSGGGAGVAVSPTTQKSLSVRVTGTAINNVTLLGWCYSGGTWGRLPAYDLTLAGRAPESPAFVDGATMPVPPSCTRLYWQTESIRPAGLSHTVTVSLTTDASTASCTSLVVGVASCGTTAAAVPTTRSAGSTSIEITNSPENAGSPKVKCDINPSDGGVGFGATLPGLVRTPGESLYLPLDSTHTIMCVCDTPATGLTTTECVP